MRQALLLILAVVLPACATPTPSATPQRTEFVIPTPSPKPSPTKFMGRYGFLVATPLGYSVQREDSTADLGTFDLEPIAVAPDGRFVVGWTRSGTELQIRDVQRPSAVVRSTKLPDGERGTAVTWSVDESGVLFSVRTPTSGALRTLDVTSATSAPKEVARFDGVTLRPMVWDRLGGDFVSALIVDGGAATEYVTIRGTDTPQRKPLPSRRWQETPAVSGDGAFVVIAAQAEPLLRTFQSHDPNFIIETQGLKADSGAAAIGRPQSAQLGVLLDRQFYIWDPKGAREPFVTEELYGIVCFRFDGSAAVVRTATGLALLDVATKKLSPLSGDVRHGIALP
jgi:hypothetical protein